jgi:hypothetical protein
VRQTARAAAIVRSANTAILVEEIHADAQQEARRRLGDKLADG